MHTLVSVYLCHMIISSDDNSVSVFQPPRYLDATAAVAVKESKVKRIHVVIAVSIIFVTLIVVGGLLGGAMIFSKTVNDIAKVSSVFQLTSWSCKYVVKLHALH